MPDAQDLIQALGLKPHPEGGYYKETYRSSEGPAKSALPERYGGPRAFSTAIYFLLTADSFSALHRIQSDEIFHFYAGDPVRLFQFSQSGDGHEVLLGSRIDQGEQPQVIVPRGTWQGARLAAGGQWALLGCTVAPGFDFEDFELASRNALCDQWPQWRDAIERFTHPEP